MQMRSANSSAHVLSLLETRGPMNVCELLRFIRITRRYANTLLRGLLDDAEVHVCQHELIKGNWQRRFAAGPGRDAPRPVPKNGNVPTEAAPCPLECEITRTHGANIAARVRIAMESGRPARIYSAGRLVYSHEIGLIEPARL